MRGAKLGQCLLLVVAIACAAAQEPVLQTRGQDIVFANGTSFKIKGIGLGNWLNKEGYMFNFHDMSQDWIDTAFSELVGPFKFTNDFNRKFLDLYVAEDDIAFLKRAGFNTVRVPINAHLFYAQSDPNVALPVGFDLLDRVVAWCEKHGLYAIIDMHAAPGGQTGNQCDDSDGYPFLFVDADAQDKAVALWAQIAARYAGRHYVLAYELLNEPISNDFPWSYLNEYLEPFYQRATTAIRAADADHIIILGGAQANSNFSMFGPPFAQNLVYSFHFYWTPAEQKNIHKYLDFTRKYNVPLFMGESGENNNAWVRQARELFEANNIGWAFWPYKKMVQPLVPDQGGSIVFVDVPPNWDDIAAFANAPRNNFRDIVKIRPPPANITAALDGFLTNIRFRKCRVDAGFLEALGLSAGSDDVVNVSKFLQ